MNDGGHPALAEFFLEIRYETFGEFLDIRAFAVTGAEKRVRASFYLHKNIAP